jgi:DNA-binding winged helix-turn-helix (wHTH) protein
MGTVHGVSFGPYRLAGPHGPLLRRSQEVAIPPKALAVLWLLVSRAGAVVTKPEWVRAVAPASPHRA